MRKPTGSVPARDTRPNMQDNCNNQRNSCTRDPCLLRMISAAAAAAVAAVWQQCGGGGGESGVVVAAIVARHSVVVVTQ